jgi:peptidoglycan/xylan/chitin deacetylase (PgdA/CDA1 family)
MNYLSLATILLASNLWPTGIVAQGAGSQPTGTPRETPAKLVVLTFDDAVRSHFTVVRPILLEHGFSATFFVTEGFDFPTNKRDYMSWRQIRQLHLDGFEIGNHTRDHLAVTQRSLSRLSEQIEAIDAKCRQYEIPKPRSFAYPANTFHPDALPILDAAGYKFARRGGSPEHPYEGGQGVAFSPGRHHPLLIPSAGDARPDWTLDDFKAALAKARDGDIPVLQFHGVPDRQHPWVSTRPERFRELVAYLEEQGYAVVALRAVEDHLPSAPP